MLAAALLPARANPVAELAEAYEAARVAEDRRNPLAYLVAVQLLPRVSARLAPGSSADLAATEALRSLWLAQARAIAAAADRPDLLALISDEEQARPRGPVERIEAMPLELASASSRELRLSFEGDRDAAVVLMPPDPTRPREGTDVDLFVLDDRGAPVCSIERQGFPKLCRWAPRRSGEFAIRVVNRQNAKANVLVYVR